jgi:hypothetical protein
MPPYSVTWPMARADDHRIRVEIRPPALPWPVVFYFSEVRDDAEQILFVYEGSEDGAPVGLEQDGIDAEPAMRAAEHWREHRGDYQRMAEFLCGQYLRISSSPPRSTLRKFSAGDDYAEPTQTV